VCLFYAIDVKNTKGELFLLRKLQMGLIFNIQSFVHLFNLKISVARKGEKKKKKLPYGEHSYRAQPHTVQWPETYGSLDYWMK